MMYKKLAVVMAVALLMAQGARAADPGAPKFTVLGTPLNETEYAQWQKLEAEGLRRCQEKLKKEKAAKEAAAQEVARERYDAEKARHMAAWAETRRAKIRDLEAQLKQLRAEEAAEERVAAGGAAPVPAETRDAYAFARSRDAGKDVA